MIDVTAAALVAAGIGAEESRVESDGWEPQSLEQLIERIATGSQTWLPTTDGKGQEIVNVGFTLAERDIIVDALRAYADAESIRAGGT